MMIRNFGKNMKNYQVINKNNFLIELTNNTETIKEKTG